MARKFKGRTVSKETISFGVAGQLERNDDMPEMPPRHMVRFEATAQMSSVKGKFLPDGTVHEITVLTMAPSTFRVLDVSEPPEPDEPELPGLGETEAASA